MRTPQFIADSDRQVQMGAGAVAAIPAREDLLPGAGLLAGSDVERGAVAVGPVCAFAVDDGRAEATALAALPP